MTRLKTAPGFTLIELLIVVAILGIMAAASFAVVTAPAEEHVFSDIELQLEAGAGVFFSHVVGEAHQAGSIRAKSNPARLLFAGAPEKARATAYWIDSRGQLRREVVAAGEADEFTSDAFNPGSWDKRGAMLLEGVVSLGADREPSTRLWRMNLRAERRQLNREWILDRSVEVAVGDSWLGGVK